MQIPHEIAERDPADTLEQPQPAHWLDSVDLRFDELSQRGPEDMGQSKFLKGLEELGFRAASHQEVADYCREAGLNVEYNEAGYKTPVLNGVQFVQQEYRVWGVLPDMAAVDLTLTQVLEGILQKESTCIGGMIDVQPTTARWRVGQPVSKDYAPPVQEEPKVDYVSALLVECNPADRC